METWSSWLADVGRLVTLLGLARHWFSAASAAAVTWAIMKPEFTPLSRIRKAGRPERPGSSSSDRRRSEMAPISATASAMMSATKATGSAWKLPPEITSPLSNTRGLSDAAFASMGSTRAAAVGVRWVDGAAVEQGAHSGRHGNLPGLATCLVNACIKGFDRTLDGFERQAARDQRGGKHALRAEQPGQCE